MSAEKAFFDYTQKCDTETTEPAANGADKTECQQLHHNLCSNQNVLCTVGSSGKYMTFIYPPGVSHAVAGSSDADGTIAVGYDKERMICFMTGSLKNKCKQG